MAAVVKFIRDFETDYSDPRVRQWTFMGSPGPTLFIVAIYLLLIWVFLPFMKNRKPYDLTKVIRYYDLFQICYCCVIIYMMATAGWTSGELHYGCQPIDYSNKPNAIRMVSAFYWLYLLKIIELVETMFFIFRKKFNQVSGLHVYHHASTVMLAYIGCKYIGGGMASVSPMTNSFIHVVMYIYYYLSSFGEEWQKRLAPWKPKLTILQMIQFTFIILHSMTALQPNCKVPKQFLLIFIPNILVIYKMFYDFYNKSYKKTLNSNNNNVKKEE